MLLKWIGGVLILFGCSSVGFRIAANHRKEERCLMMLDRLIDYMICELQYKLTPVPELCRKVSAEATGCIKKVFDNLALELDDQVSPDVYSCVKATLNKISAIPQETKKCLLLLGKHLGKFDLQGQIQELETVRHECKRFLNALQNNKEQRLRSYQTLGICAGASLAIIFI